MSGRKMLKNPKNVFWEALVLTIAVFFFGLMIGIAYESNRAEKINDFYAKSEVSLFDIFALSDSIDSGNPRCAELIDSNLKFANRIYDEAKLLERYEDAGKITENLKQTHRKYDLLRTFLWTSSDKTLKKCPGNFSVVVYLYEYNTEDLAKKATQNVWAKVLYDLKESEGENIVLIPIAANSDLISLDLLIKKYNITNYPVVIINNKKVVKSLSSAEELRKLL